MKFKRRNIILIIICTFSVLNSCSKEDIKLHNFSNFEGVWKGFSIVTPTGNCTILQAILHLELEMNINPDGTFAILEERIFDIQDSIYIPVESHSWKGQIFDDLSIHLNKIQSQKCGIDYSIDSTFYESKIIKKDGQYILSIETEELGCPGTNCSFILEYYLTKEITINDGFPSSQSDDCINSIFTDSRDGQTYKIVQIGNQCWFAENLRYSGNIPEVTGRSDWETISNEGAWCYLYNDPSNDTLYGKLYNWYAVNSKSLCPPGWHIPSDIEWFILTNHLGGNYPAAAKMKSRDGWEIPDPEITDSSGFTGLPGGLRRYDGGFNYSRSGGYWWSSSEYKHGGNTAILRALSQYSREVGRANYDKNYGLSCRCVKD